eukprot:CAMPEP_0198702974 /NCGR_PEP_ID=MMETSP1468-20131203/389066_1 /TAXON_ID=1461545 /ORGANISM="Mantoniella sp, Strain CCMP1436" /LENGTH=309 /DNA_ID=CAMNT_0044461601 /DNA_START=1804 /DNA_END=2736 /DNA_ORIENTATION=+
MVHIGLKLVKVQTVSKAEWSSSSSSSRTFARSGARDHAGAGFLLCPAPLAAADLDFIFASGLLPGLREAGNGSSMSSTSPSSAQPLLSTAVRAPPPGAFAVALAAPTADCLLIGYPCTAATAPTPDPPPALSPTLGSKFFLGLNAVAMALSMRLSNSPFPPIPLFTDAILGPSGGGRAVGVVAAAVQASAPPHDAGYGPLGCSGYLGLPGFPEILRERFQRSGRPPPCMMPPLGPPLQSPPHDASEWRRVVAPIFWKDVALFLHFGLRIALDYPRLTLLIGFLLQPPLVLPEDGGFVTQSRGLRARLEG